MAIRRFENTEILADIWLRASLEAHSFIDAAYWEGNYEAMKCDYLPPAENYAYIDDGSGQVQGFISLGGSHIEALFVDPCFQGRGVGRALLDHAKRLRGGLTLAVYERNARAVGFYERNGFVVNERRIDPALNEPELVMEFRQFAR